MIVSAQYITDFGDSAVTGTLCIVLAAAFFVTRNRQASLAMLLAFGMAALLTVIGKIAFFDCWLNPATGLRSPSGHAAISAAVYGTLALIFAAPMKEAQRRLVYAATILFVLLIAATRVILGHHSAIEVVCGLTVGAASCALAGHFCLRRGPAIVNRVMFVAIAVVAIVLVHGIRLPAEALIDNIAAHLTYGCVKKS